MEFLYDVLISVRICVTVSSRTSFCVYRSIPGLCRLAILERSSSHDDDTKEHQPVRT